MKGHMKLKIALLLVLAAAVMLTAQSFPVTRQQVTALYEHSRWYDVGVKEGEASAVLAYACGESRGVREAILLHPDSESDVCQQLRNNLLRDGIVLSIQGDKR